MSTHSFLRLRRRLAILPLALALGACGLGGGDAEATPEDVDQESSATVTEEELASFSEPADSVLSEAQVEAYLKTSLLQFDLIRKESVALHEKAQEMEGRAEDGGFISGLRNLADAGSLVMGWTDLVGGSYVRSARSLGYNPAEMEWVRDRVSETTTYLAAKPMQEMMAQQAAGMREQAEQMRAQMEAGQLPGFTQEDVDQMVASADEMLAETQGQQPEGALARNLEVLHRARGQVTDPMWQTIGWTGGAMGLAALGGLADPADTEAQKTLDEIRTVYQAALENRVVPGLGEEPAAGSAAPEAQPGS